LSDLWHSRVESVLNVVVHVAVKILLTVVTDAEPLDNSLNSESQVVLRDCEVVVLGVAVRVVWVVNEMEIRLPSTAVVLDIVSESSALDERLVTLTVGKGSVVNFQILEHSDSLIERVRAHFQKTVLGNVSHCNKKMSAGV